jgi:Family of unknown function (DUF695)/Regulator of ribonuclease activity B
MSDDWDFFSLRVDDQAASIFVDLGIRNLAPIRTHPLMGYLRVAMRRPREDGLSSQEEFDDLIALEDRVTADIVKNGTAIYVGRNTSSGNRDFFFYATDAPRFENAARTAMGEFPSYKYETGMSEDRDWQTYFDFLHPPDADLQRIKNRRVRERLDKHGDNASNKREIDHFAYFPNAAAQTAFADYARAEGFAVAGADRPNAGGQFGLRFSKVDQPARIDDIVLPLVRKITELGGEYDGWGCGVTP